MSALWAKFETQVVNGAFPLERCVGSTERSAVFLTQATRHAPSAVALKLVRFDPATAADQLRRWREAAGLSHPHLLRIFEAGECWLEGAQFLYLRTEYADQTLGQLLMHRTLTEEEARDLLAPTLDALDYLHARNLAHDGLKASNVLVVGDRLKLASDTLRPFDEAGRASPATDVRALGALLSQTLTGSAPAPGGDLPAALPPAFRAIIARCLSAAPAERPTVAGLRAWLEAGAPAAEPAPPPATRLRIRVELPPESGPAAQPAPSESRRPALPWVVAALIVVGIAVGGGLYLRRASEPAAEPAAGARTPAPTPVAPPPPAPVAPPVAVEPAAPAAPASPVHEVLPQVSRNALGTIRGTLRVAIRVTVDERGAVTSAVTDVAGPSRYFEQRSLEAARGWTFGPGPERRSLRLRFAFTRGGVTAAATPVP